MMKKATFLLILVICLSFNGCSEIKHSKNTDSNTAASRQTKIHTERISTNKNITDSEANYVYITDTGKKYHKKTCSSLSKSKYKINIKKAKKQGYTPCSRCKP